MALSEGVKILLIAGAGAGTLYTVKQAQAAKEPEGGDGGGGGISGPGLMGGLDPALLALLEAQGYDLSLLAQDQEALNAALLDLQGSTMPTVTDMPTPGATLTPDGYLDIYDEEAVTNIEDLLAQQAAAAAANEQAWWDEEGRRQDAYWSDLEGQSEEEHSTAMQNLGEEKLGNRLLIGVLGAEGARLAYKGAKAAKGRLMGGARTVDAMTDAATAGRSARPPAGTASQPKASNVKASKPQRVKVDVLDESGRKVGTTRATTAPKTSAATGTASTPRTAPATRPALPAQTQQAGRFQALQQTAKTQEASRAAQRTAQTQRAAAARTTAATTRTTAASTRAASTAARTSRVASIARTTGRVARVAGPIGAVVATGATAYQERKNLAQMGRGYTDPDEWRKGSSTYEASRSVARSGTELLSIGLIQYDPGAGGPLGSVKAGGTTKAVTSAASATTSFVKEQNKKKGKWYNPLTWG